ncbi:hypothetical protein BDW74DRAFT_144087 [Aspergillus multicolor]|uniref:uncharacterized protein n=1 Tax=Aspergillus multicolor TaxID=41759 RepID=UPI003CCCE887
MTKWLSLSLSRLKMPTKRERKDSKENNTGSSCQSTRFSLPRPYLVVGWTLCSECPLAIHAPISILCLCGHVFWLCHSLTVCAERVLSIRSLLFAVGVCDSGYWV